MYMKMQILTVLKNLLPALFFNLVFFIVIIKPKFKSRTYVKLNVKVRISTFFILTTVFNIIQYKIKLTNSIIHTYTINVITQIFYLYFSIIVAFVLEAFILEYSVPKSAMESRVEKTIRKLGSKSRKLVLYCLKLDQLK